MKRPQCLLLTTLTLRASIDTMFCDLGDALRRRGVYTRTLVDVPQAPNVALAHGLVGELRDYDGPRFIIDINAKSRLQGQGADGKPVFIHDAWNIPRLSIFESNPIHHLSQMAEMPAAAAVAVIDDAHRAVFDAFDIKTHGVDFLAHAGPPPLATILPMAERPIDVLFLGNVKDVPEPEAWIDALPCASMLKPAIAAIVAQRWQATPDGVADALTHALIAQGIAAEPRRDLALGCTIEIYINNLKRIELLRSIDTGRITVAGEIGIALPNAAHITATGPIGFVEALQLMDNAKIVLNTMPFRSGAHERIFYGLSRGVFSLSDYSTLLETVAAEESGVAFFPDDIAALGERIATLLASDLDAGVAAGRRWYARRHTWDQRAQQILDFMAPLFWATETPATDDRVISQNAPAARRAPRSIRPMPLPAITPDRSNHDAAPIPSPSPRYPRHATSMSRQATPYRPAS
jgi:hypothetical protein